MKASELRIGNYVLLDDKGIYQIDSGHDIDEIDSFPWDNPYCIGIPLTEEWLLDFGFEKETHGFYKYPIEVRINGNIVTMLGHKTSLRNIGINTKYVHQLQNLYFALTGEELTKK